MFWKQKAYAGAIWAAATVLTLIIVYTLPAVYKSDALILVDSQKIPEKYVAATVNADLEDRLTNISQQILSSTRLLKLMDTFDLYREERKSKVQEEILEAMRKDINIKLEKGWRQDRPGAFRVSFQGPNPTVVSNVANQIGNFFIEENLRSREVQAEGTSEFLQNQLAQARKTLDEHEAKLSAYKVNRTGQLPQQAEMLNAALARLQVELSGNQDAINRTQQTKVMLENAKGIAESTLQTLTRAAERATAAGAVPMAGPAPARRKSDQLLGDLQSLRARLSDEHPEVRRLQFDLAAVLAAEEKELKESPAVPTSGPASGDAASAGKTDEKAVAPSLVPDIARERERVANLRTQHDLATRDLEILSNDRKRVLRDIANFQGRVEQLPLREQEMASLTRDYEITKGNYQSLLDKKLAAEMATDMERRQKAERFTMLDPARIPEKPFSPNRLMLNIIGILAGLVLAVAAAIGREFRKNTLLGEWELPGEILVLGRVPRIDLTLTEAGDRQGRRGGKSWRVAAVSSALLSLLTILAAGVYYGWSRF